MSFSRAARAEPDRPLLESAARGAWHGAWTVAIGTAPAALLYLWHWHEEPLPWVTLGVQLATFAPLCGALYGAAIAVGLRLADQAHSGVARGARGLSLPALLGAVGGAAPGAFAAWHFGSMPFPYFGTLEILGAGVMAFFLFGTFVLRADGVPWRRALVSLGAALGPLGMLVGGLLLAPLPGVGWMSNAVVLEGAAFFAALAVGGALVGAIVGLLFGGLIGAAWLIAGASARAGR